MSVPWRYIYSFLMLLPNRPHSYVKFIWNVHKHVNIIKTNKFTLIAFDLRYIITNSNNSIKNTLSKSINSIIIMLKRTMLNRNLKPSLYCNHTRVYCSYGVGLSPNYKWWISCCPIINTHRVSFALTKRNIYRGSQFNKIVYWNSKARFFITIWIFLHQMSTINNVTELKYTPMFLNF